MLPASPRILHVASCKPRATIYSPCFQKKKCDFQRPEPPSLAVTLRSVFTGSPAGCWSARDVPKICSAYWSFQAIENQRSPETLCTAVSSAGDLGTFEASAGGPGAFKAVGCADTLPPSHLGSSNSLFNRWINQGGQEISSPIRVRGSCSWDGLASCLQLLLQSAGT